MQTGVGRHDHVHSTGSGVQQRVGRSAQRGAGGGGVVRQQDVQPIRGGLGPGDGPFPGIDCSRACAGAPDAEAWGPPRPAGADRRRLRPAVLPRRPDRLRPIRICRDATCHATGRRTRRTGERPSTAGRRPDTRHRGCTAPRDRPSLRRSAGSILPCAGADGPRNPGTKRRSCHGNPAAAETAPGRPRTVFRPSPSRAARRGGGQTAAARARPYSVTRSPRSGRLRSASAPSRP